MVSYLWSDLLYRIVSQIHCGAKSYWERFSRISNDSMDHHRYWFGWPRIRNNFYYPILDCNLISLIHAKQA